MTSIMPLDRVGRHDEGTAGGKGANLGEMLGNGFPVPPGFVLTVEACRNFFSHVQLGRLLPSLLSGSILEISRQCRSIRDLITGADLPPDLTEAIFEAHASLSVEYGKNPVCVVRSSATAEDSVGASYAGQHATYYYVDRDRLLSMIKYCWASLFNPEAVSYRNSQGVDHQSVFMAVIVQVMVRSEVSGVTFTANPVTGSTEEVVTESCWGMGAAIVDGRVTPDQYIVKKDGLGLIKKRIANKRFMVPTHVDPGVEERLVEVPHEMSGRETLSGEQVQNVARWAVSAEEYFKAPQDIEWALENGRFYLLQSRPITTMGREDIGRGVKGKYVLFKPMVENFTEPLTPLTVEMFSIILGPPLMRYLRGWGYIDIDVFRLLLPFKITDQETAWLMYGLVNDVPDMKISFPRLILTTVIGIMIHYTLGPLLTRTRHVPDGFLDQYRQLCRKVDRNRNMGPIEAFMRLFSWSRFFDPVGYQPGPVNILSGRYMLWSRVLQKLLRKWAPEVREEAESLLCSGAQGVLSAEMGRGIWALAKEAKSNEALSRLFENTRVDKLLLEIWDLPEADAFSKLLDDFLIVNGHRGLKELELMSRRWEENPTPILGMIRNYMLMDSNPEEHEMKVERAREELEAEIKQALAKFPLERRLGLRWRIIKYIAEKTKYFSKMRENTRFYHIMTFHVIRKKVLEIETKLRLAGKIKCKDDIFFLLWKEIADAMAGKLEWRDIEERIRRRRMDYIRLSKMMPPKAVGMEFDYGPGPETETADGGVAIQGQAASAGKYEGKARVIMDPSVDVEIKPGEILVAPYTDPAWTPLFLTAGAAVVEIGSYLSHAGTVAREFGMPCVVDAVDCTNRIRTGDRILVDGDRGQVRILDGETENQPPQGGAAL